MQERRNRYMITEDYVGFETAKLMKEKGFDEICYLGYNKNGEYIGLSMNTLKKIWLRLLSRISNKITTYVTKQILKEGDK